MSRARAGLVLALLAVLPIAGCGDSTAIRGGGVVGGERLTIYSLLPRPAEGAARDIVDGERLALREAGARAGGYTLNFASLDETAGLPETTLPERVAAAAREAIGDPQVIAAIGDLDAGTARFTVPLFNAAGILHVSPGVTYPGFTTGVEPDEPERYEPSGARRFFPLAADDVRQARALARALPRRVLVEQEESTMGRVFGAALREALGPERLVAGAEGADAAVYAGADPESARGVVESLLRENRRLIVYLPAAAVGSSGLAARARVRALGVWPPPSPAFARAFRAAFERDATPAAMAGYDAMRRVLAALRAAGGRANSRQALIDAFAAAAAQAGEPPVYLDGRRLP